MAEGDSTLASGQASHAEGYATLASGSSSHAEGYLSKAGGNYSHAEGYETVATGLVSHAEGYRVIASGYGSHAEGQYNTASGELSHAEGSFNNATGQASHAEGNGTQANGAYSHAEGSFTQANGAFSHAEGVSSQANGDASHAEGSGTQANGAYSHAEGDSTIASGMSAHAEGVLTIAGGNNSHAGGVNSIASGNTSFVHGNHSQANGYNTIVLGASITGNTDNTTYVDNLLVKSKLGVNTTAALADLHSVGSLRIENKSNEDFLEIEYRVVKPGSDGIIYTNWVVPSYDNRMYKYYSQHSDTDFTNIFYHPSTGYNNKNGSSTYFMYFETGYDDALKQNTVFQLNGVDKLSLLENGNVVLGQADGVNNTYPSILRASNAYLYAPNTPGKDITIQSGSGRGTGVGGTIKFETATSGTTGSVLNTPVTRMTITPNGKVNVLQILNISNVSVYADNAAATSGGLAVGDVYRTSTGILMIRY